MLITSILLIAMLGAIVLATGSVEEDKTALPSTKITGTINLSTGSHPPQIATVNPAGISSSKDNESLTG